MSTSDGNSYRVEAELRDQPVPFISSPLRRVPSLPPVSSARHTNRNDDSPTNLHYVSTVSSLPSGTVSSLPSGKIYRKSMQYSKERKEKKLRQLEELTSIKRDTSMTPPSALPPSPSPLSRSQSLLVTVTGGSIGGAISSSKIPSSPGSAFSAPPSTSSAASNNGLSRSSATVEYLVPPTATSKARSLTPTTEKRHQDMILLAKALQKPPSLKTTRRLQEGLERSYPLYRMDAKKQRKEAKFHLLTKKAQDYHRLKYDRNLPSRSSSSPHAKENHAPSSSAKSLDTEPTGAATGTVSISTSYSSICSQGNRRRPISPGPRSSDGSATSAPGSNSSRKPDTESTRGTTNATTSLTKPLEAFFTFDLNCIRPRLDECSPVQTWPPSPEPPECDTTPMKDTASAVEELLSSSMQATEALSNRDEMLSPQTTRVELMKIRQELRVRKRAKKRRQSATNAAAAGAATSKKTSKEQQKQQQEKVKVRFAEPVVSEIRHRPYTRPEDIEKLYFIEEELDELEWDRATVEGAQFEVALDDLGKGRKDVSVTYMNKRSIIDRARNSSTGELIPFSPSDLSAIYE